MKLIFYKAWNNPKATMLDKIVALFSLGKYSHTEIHFSNDEAFSISPRENTIRFKKIDVNPQRWDSIDINLSIKEELQVYKYCVRLAQRKYKYDYIGALSSPLRLCIQNKNKYFCSEICANILQEQNIFQLEKGCKYTPVRLSKEILKIKEI